MPLRVATSLHIETNSPSGVRVGLLWFGKNQVCVVWRPDAIVVLSGAAAFSVDDETFAEFDGRSSCSSVLRFVGKHTPLGHDPIEEYVTGSREDLARLAEGVAIARFHFGLEEEPMRVVINGTMFRVALTFLGSGEGPRVTFDASVVR